MNEHTAAFLGEAFTSHTTALLQLRLEQDALFGHQTPGMNNTAQQAFGQVAEYDRRASVSQIDSVYMNNAACIQQMLVGQSQHSWGSSCTKANTISKFKELHLEIGLLLIPRQVLCHGIMSPVFGRRSVIQGSYYGQSLHRGEHHSEVNR